MAKTTTVSPAEFSKIPLDFIISTPLLTTIEAHKVAAATTLDFVRELSGKKETFVTKVEAGANAKTQEITVPTLSIVKVPSLNFDSLSVSFSYNISQVTTEKNDKKSKAALDVGTTGLLSKFVSAQLTGSIENTSSRENTANRGGTLDIKIHVSESGLPPGLAKVINAITENIEVPAP
jgi:hypothetical protein